MQTQCCQCKRVQIDGAWADAPTSADTPVSHTYCPSCLLRSRIQVFTAFASDNPRDAETHIQALLSEVQAVALPS